MSVTEEVVARRKKRRSQTHHGEPRRPVMVMDIIKGRRDRKESWQAMGERWGITRAGARHLYHKWYDWYLKLNNIQDEEEPTSP